MTGPLRSLRTPESRSRFYYGLVSLLIAGFLAVQFEQSIPVLRWLIPPEASGWRGWLRYRPMAPNLYPFVNYPMYSVAHAEGEPVLEPRVRAVLADGRVLPIRPEDFGLRYFPFKVQVVQQIERAQRDGTRIERLRALMRPIEAREGQPVGRLMVLLEPIWMHSDGLRYGELRPHLNVRLFPVAQTPGARDLEKS